MIPIDPSAIPKIPVRKALIVIDFQNDFIDNQGALPVKKPEGLVGRTLRLASHFRKIGHVVWACSEFARSRPVTGESILTADESVPLEANAPRRSAKLQIPADVDSEAFLTQGGAACVRSPSGSQIPPHIKETFGPRDITFIKSHYSAFKSGQLLHLLRGRLITELYVCGSLGNVGVYATAVDAAMYGYGITVVEDCCGFISVSRRDGAIQAMVEATGCELVNSNDVLGDAQANRSAIADPRPRSQASTTPLTAAPDLHEKLAALKLIEPQPSMAQSETSVTSTALPLEVDPDAQPVVSNDGGPTINASLTSPGRPSHISRRQEKEASAEKKMQATGAVPPVAAQSSGPESPKRSDGGAPEVTDGVTPDHVCSLAAKDEACSSRGAVNDTTGRQATTTGAFCEGDTTVIYNVLPPHLEAGIFDKLKDEVKWQRMSHQGGEVPRLVAVQGTVADDGSMPVYRHPSDQAPALLPFSPLVALIKAEAEKHLGHPLNHVLIQFYRDGSDYISEHSDKTLDIVKGSYITNVSLGAERTMVFRTKRATKEPNLAHESSGRGMTEGLRRKIQRAQLPHNSLCRVGLLTNMRWLHSIKQDKRSDRDKSDTELAFQGGRISLTFRQIGTYLDRDGTLIWGQGATSKTRATAQPVINGQGEEMVAMLRAFGKENHSSHFDWDEYYGKGFDVLHMSSSPRFFYCSDAVINSRIRLALAEYGISYAKGSMAPSASANGEVAGQEAAVASAMVRFVDNDAVKTRVQGDLAILLYLDEVYGRRGPASSPREQADLARMYTRLQQALALSDRWRDGGQGFLDLGPATSALVRKELVLWEDYAAEAAFIADSVPTLADFAFLPILHRVRDLDPDLLGDFVALGTYHKKFLQRRGVADILAKIGARRDGGVRGDGGDVADRDPSLRKD